MRPLSLTMTAFGPFPGRETIDFTALGENPLFLINGPTGSGKTTILDAICFALYGKTTGAEREGAQMRSDLAADDTLTEVNFKFELAGRRFAIRRSPEQQRPKARGEGFTTQAPEAEFRELLEGGGENLIVASKVSEATREIEELTGLSVDQFRQVMVLPQGQFRQLLMADSGEREKIFGQLFQTRIYRRLEERLKSRAADIRRERERQLQLQQGMLEGASLESVGELDRELAELEPAEKTARDHKAAREAALAAADKACEQARTLLAEFTRLEATTAALKQHEAEKVRVEGERQQLQRAEQAGKLQPLFRDLRRCETDLTQAGNAVEAATSRHRAAEQTLAEATRKQAATAGLQQELEEAKQLAAQLEGYKARSANLTAARQACEEAALATEQSGLLLDFKRLADQYLFVHELERLVRELRTLDTAVREKQAQEAQRRQTFAELEQQAKELELAWHRGQAAILAAELKAGEPCPVCGSLDHPGPASATRKLPSQQEVERARQQAREAFSAIESAQKQTAAAVEKLHDLERSIAARQESVDRSLSLDELKIRIGEVQKQAAELAFVLPDRQQVVDLDAETLRTQLQNSKEALTEARARKTAAEQELPENYRAPGVLEQAITQARQRIDQGQRQIDELNAARQRAATELAVAERELHSARGQQQKAAAARQQAADEFQAALTVSPFADAAAMQAALLDEQRSAEVRQRIADYDAAGQRLTGALQQLQAQLSEQARPDLASLEAQRQSAEAEKNQAVAAWQQLDKRLSLLLDTRKKLQKAAAEREELDRQYAVVGTLSDVANGQTGDKISLQRFVLSVLLDDVLIEASRRLALMSKGRYRLLRREDRAKGNKASGLELEVEDAYTGKLRPVATLSGGESFMAALSLALGLSDVVQAYAGGIRLDTLFIDEGFGSLDAESLELAIRTLVDLQATGRMVGIISHVAELKEQLARRIDVLAGRAGSSIRAVVP